MSREERKPRIVLYVYYLNVVVLGLWGALSPLELELQIVVRARVGAGSPGPAGMPIKPTWVLSCWLALQ